MSVPGRGFTSGRRRTTVAVVAVTATALAAAAVATLPLGGESPSPRAAPGSTIAATYLDRDGDGFLERATGERLLNRTELAPASPPRRELALFAQISDAHVRDEESPARAVQLDRLGPPFTNAFRPQEALSGQTLAATVSTVNELRPQAVLVTGDLIDSAQENELEQALAILEGGAVEPDSGAPGYDGPQSARSADPFVYRPAVDAPVHEGLLASAQRSFASPGLEAPWYPVLGNHELLVQGEVAPTAQLGRIAVGGRRLVELDPDLRVPERAREPLISEALAGGLPGRTRPTPADASRRYLESSEVVDRLRQASGIGGDGNRLDYSFDIGPALRVIVLDLVRRGGDSSGRITGGQVVWLRRELRRAGRRFVLVASHHSLAGSAGGERALAALDRHPRVVAAVSGHGHEHSIKPRRSAGGGYWLIGTASLADYPQQARALRLVETAGGVALETWVLDHSSAGLAEASRELAFLDAQGGRPRDWTGTAADRNARLHLTPGRP